MTNNECRTGNLSGTTILVCNMNYWIFLIPTLFIVILSFAAIGVKMFVKKDGKFERKCAHSLDPDAKCVCGGNGKCKNDKK